jgi:hypothetical protein
MVLYVWNQRFDFIFCDSSGASEVGFFYIKIVIQDAILT